jgi:type II secretory pathway predicted ATPase ExeA
MYESFFGFSQRPFTAAPRTDRYFPASAIEAARQTLERCIDRAEGCGLVVGPVGTGKSLLCQVLAEQFGDRMDAVVLSGAMISSRKELLQAITYELELPYKRLHEGELRLAMIDRLSPTEECPEGMLLIVDEAHLLSPKLLEELRLLTNLVRGGSPRVRLVMVGAPVLEERFAIPRLASFNQRIVARCFLESFSAEETREYIRAQTAAGGAEPDSIWSAEALLSVHHATDGCPRLINQLSDMVLMLASVAQSRVVDVEMVNESWAELQQIPAPWNTTSNPDAVGGAPSDSTVIEFGSLDDEYQSDSEVENELDVSLEDDSEFDDEAIEPVEHLDRIQSHLADVAGTYFGSEPVDARANKDDTLANDLGAKDLFFSNARGHGDRQRLETEVPIAGQQPDWPASSRELPSEQITLEFEQPALDAMPPQSADTGATIEINGAVECGPLAEYDSFAGLEGSTVVQLSPNPRPLSAEDPEPELHTEALSSQKHNWLSGLERAMNQQAGAELDDNRLPQSPNVGLHNPHMALQGQSPVDPRFMDMQFVENEGRVVEDKSFDPVAPMPSVVVEYPGDDSLGGDNGEVNAPVNINETLELGSSIDVVDSSSNLGAVPHGPLQNSVEADATADIEIRSPVRNHPTIPVGQRDYRQLFSKLRQRQNQQRGIGNNQEPV